MPKVCLGLTRRTFGECWSRSNDRNGALSGSPLRLVSEGYGNEVTIRRSSNRNVLFFPEEDSSDGFALVVTTNIHGMPCGDRGNDKLRDLVCVEVCYEHIRQLLHSTPPLSIVRSG